MKIYSKECLKNKILTFFKCTYIDNMNYSFMNQYEDNTYSKLKHELKKTDNLTIENSLINLDSNIVYKYEKNV